MTWIEGRAAFITLPKNGPAVPRCARQLRAKALPKTDGPRVYSLRDFNDNGATIAGRGSRNGRPRSSRPPSTQTATPDTLKEAPLEVFGTIKQVFPSTTFSVELENGHVVLAHIAGRLRRHRIKILPGDRVDLEMSPYDLTKGRIVYRYRAGEARRST